MFLEEEKQEDPVASLNYKPRRFFKAFHARHQKRAVLVCHRRAGKTEAALYDEVDKALRIQWRDTRPSAPPVFGYVAPYKTQARDVIWRRLMVIVQKIPGAKSVPSRLEVELPNGALIKLYGADDEDSIRGQYFDGIILDECGDIKPEFWRTVQYCLSDYSGWVVFMGTPKGKNSFYRRFLQAKGNPDKWFHLLLKQSDSGILTEEEVQEIIEDCDDDPDFVAQELECSFEASIKGSYYGKHIQVLRDREPSPIKFGAEAAALYNPRLPVSLSFDIGRRDAMAIWFWQINNGWCNFIKYFEETGWDADETIEFLQLQPYNYQTIWLPHDAAHETFRSNKSVIDVFRDAELPVKQVRDPDRGLKVFHGLNAVRKVLKTFPIQFDGKDCARGLECLSHYSHKWDSRNNVFVDDPKHDEWSHGADAFRAAALSIQIEDIINSRTVLNANSRQIVINKAITRNSAPTLGDLKTQHLRNRARAASSTQRW